MATLTQECLTDHLKLINCCFAEKSRSYFNQLRGGKDNQDLYFNLIMVDNILYLLCNQDVSIAEDDRCFTDEQLCGIVEYANKTLDCECDCCN